MQKRALILLGLAVLLARPALSAIESQEARAFVGQDLHLSGVEVISCQLSPIEYALVFQNGFTMSIGANRFSSSKAVLWLESARVEFAGQVRVDYRARAYLEGDISVDKAQGAKTTELTEKTIEQGAARVIWFGVGGEVFVTADKREAADVRELEFYKKALTAVTEVERALEKPLPVILPEKKPEVAVKPEEKKPLFRYPVNLAPVSEIVPKIEWDEEKGTGIVIGRFYLWQKQDEQGGLLELQADNAVIFYSPQDAGQSQKPQAGKKPAGEDFLARGAADAVYLSGDVVMTEGQRTIRAQELYYDFQGKRGIAVNAVMRNFDEMQGIPIYVRAARLRQLAENKFAAENITLTTSEFYVPQISLNASQIIITDMTSADQQEKGVTSKGSYDAQMQDVRLKMYDKTIFYWPSMRSNLQRPDIPLKSMHAGYDGTWGATIETQWYLARLLGLQESEGTDSTIMLDYYSKHGMGSGVEIEYERENYFGNILGYIINDSGEDRLGRDDSRKDLEPPRELRGRFRWQHRQFLPYDWQLTTEVSYLSDENFLEAYYRDEFNLDKEQETLIHLKRIQDNWGIAFLGKWRINDSNTLEELPSAEFHWTGQSLFDDRFTLYSDSLLGRFRQRLAPDSDVEVSQDFFTFGSTRNELDLPLTVGRTKVVPFIAGTVGYDDGDGFRTDLDGMPEEREDNVLIGEAGVRVSPQPYWKVFPGVKSRLWDLNQMRHIISPHLTAVGFAENDSTGEQRDAINVGISQRLQTRRGPVGKERTVDWMRLDMDITWVNNSGDTSAGPDRFIWNKPFIPLLNRYSTNVPQLDRRGGDIFGPRRNSFCADYIWRLTDTTALLSDMNFDIQSSVVQQFNVGFSHMRWPNLSYYVGSRYLRRFDNGLGEEGSNAFVFAATYVLDPRYTIVFSQQFDFDYGENVRSDITLIRRYHRIYWGITFSADESLDSHAIVFSLWPEGVPGLGIGPRRYMDLGPSVGARY